MDINRYQFTSESVTEGHPDKLCDQVSDAVLDAYLAQDPMARVACECCATTGVMLVMGEIASSAVVNVQEVARGVIRDVGYTNAAYGFDCDSSAVVVTLDRQSPDIALGVDRSLEAKSSGGNDIGAGDQGMMFGYACDDTPQNMPMAVQLSHQLTKKLAELRKSGAISWLRPDGKAQVTAVYEGNTFVGVDAIVVSTQHAPDVAREELVKVIEEQVIRAVVPASYFSENTRIFINPTGQFVTGGPQGDSGLTGRKIIVDTYGGFARHGGGCFSGKDPTKVDRSASYMARYAARNVVAAGLARRCEIQLAYAIGVAKPVSLWVEAYGTGAVSNAEIAKALSATLDFRPAAIIDTLQLRRPIYRQVAAYGHFGRDDLDLPWEKLNAAATLRDKAGR